jgi:hypothetical protein
MVHARRVDRYHRKYIATIGSCVRGRAHSVTGPQNPDEEWPASCHRNPVLKDRVHLRLEAIKGLQKMDNDIVNWL